MVCFGFFTLEDGIDNLSRNAGKNYHSSLRNDPEARGSLHLRILEVNLKMINSYIQETEGMQLKFLIEFSHFPTLAVLFKNKHSVEPFIRFTALQGYSEISRSSNINPHEIYKFLTRCQIR